MSIYAVTLTYVHEDLGIDQKNETADTNGENKSPPKGGCAVL